MATRAATFNRDIDARCGVITVTWAGLLQSSSDTGAPVMLSEFSDKTFQVFGTLGASGACLIEGSNDGTNWAPLSNRQGTSMSFTTASLNTSQDRPVWVRPRITAGDGTTNLTCVVVCHRADLSGVG